MHLKLHEPNAGRQGLAFRGQTINAFLPSSNAQFICLANTQMRLSFLCLFFFYRLCAFSGDFRWKQIRFHLLKFYNELYGNE